jgi:hypothetical protein
MHWNGELRRNPFGGVDCDELLKTLDFVTVTYVHRARESPQISRELGTPAGFFNRIDFPKGRHWLWLCSSGFKWAPAQIQLRHGSCVVPVTLGEDLNARVHFPRQQCNDRADLGYPVIEGLITQLGHSAEVAREMLERVQGNSRKSFNEYDGVIDAAVVLMFGVETGRKLSMCATSLMLLELIAANKPCADPCDKPFTWASAFHQERRKRPMAAIRAELSIMRHWLELTELLGDYNQLSVKGRILKLLRTYLG